MPKRRDGTRPGKGVRVSLQIDGEIWHRVASLVRSGADDPHYVVRENPDGTTTVTFGDGVQGRRLPAGRDRIIATYRPSRRYVAVLLQPGRVILDSDWNEDAAVRGRFYGVYAGVVTDRRDPGRLRRLKVKVPAVLGVQEVWALPCLPVGAMRTPAAGRPIWVAFEGGDPAHPVWLGTMGPAH